MAMQPVIRHATNDDLSAMYLISLHAHQLSYENLIPHDRKQDFTRRYTLSDQSRESYVSRMKQRLSGGEWTIWVATVSDVVVGYTLAQRVDEHLVLKRGLFVDPKFQGMGIGKMLFVDSLKIAQPGDTVRLVVLKGNIRAKHLYENYGFKVTGRAPKDFFGAQQEVMELKVN